MQEKTASEILNRYMLSHAQVTFIGRSQNTTYRVDTATQGKFLLRIHHGIDTDDDLSQGFWQEPSMIRSELLWLDALRRDTDLVVPEPIQNQDGQWVTELPSSAFEKTVWCTLLHWIDGQHLETDPTQEQVFQLGVLQAHLHQHAACWSQPSNFKRPTYDANYFYSSLRQLCSLRGQEIMSSGDYEVFQTAIEKVQQLMLDLERTPNTWGIVHADLHEANYILHQKQICPLDFGRCGFAFYLYDVALTLNYIHPSMRCYLFEGYQSVRPIASNYQPIAEAFFVASTVDNFAFLSTNPQEYKELAHAVPQVIHDHFKPYLRGEPFLFDR